MRALAVYVIAVGCVRANQAVVTQHNDIRRTGANLRQRTLTPSRVTGGIWEGGGGLGADDARAGVDRFLRSIVAT